MQPSQPLRIRGLTHDHIDGSKAFLDVYAQLCDMNGIPPEQRLTPEQIVAYFDDVHDDLVRKFGYSNEYLQTPETLELMGYAYGRRRASERYTYVEGQFAPQYHCKKGMTMWQVTSCMIAGLQRAEREFGIRIFPVIDIGREADPAVGEEIADIAISYRGKAGLGLACVELGAPPENHLRAFARTFNTDVPRIIHAGEWVEAEPANTYEERLLRNVRTSLFDLHATDIGHAIPLWQDRELMREIAYRNVRISMCPLSNKTLGKIERVRDLRIIELLSAGVKVTINPDDDLFLPDMSAVVAECEREYGFTDAQRRALEANALIPATDLGH